MERRSNALVAFWADIEPSYVERYRQWHTEEHIPERVAIPGFDTGQRYARVDGGRMFFMYYDTASPEVLKSDAYLHALNHPTPWTTESLRYFRNPLRNLYRLLQEQGAAPGRASDFIVCARFDVAPRAGVDPTDVALEILDASLPEGVHRGRLFEIDQAATGVTTKEREIYGQQAEDQRYLVLVERVEPADRKSLDALVRRLGDAGADSLALDQYALELGLRSTALVV